MIKLAQAQELVTKVIRKATELQQNVSVAVVDEHGDLLYMAKMDGALVISPQFAQAKARTSALLGLPTSQISTFAQPGKPYFGITDAFGGELMTIAGGVPITEGGAVIGGIGVGGSYDVTVDEQIAQSALT